MEFDEKEFKIFCISIGIYHFAISIIKIFVPLYLLNKGFSISSILLFFALTQFSRFIFVPVSAALSSSFGAKKIISLSFVISIIFYLILDKIDILYPYFFICAILLGASQAFMWVPYHVHLSKLSANNKRGKIVGKLGIYINIASGLGPFLGGLIISIYGFIYGFATVIILIIPAVLLLMSTPEKSKIRKIKFRHFDIHKIYPDIIANGFYNFQTFINVVVWTIIIYSVVPQYETIGIIQSVSLLFSIIAFIIIGKWTDMFNRKKLLFWGTIVNSSVEVMRILATTVLSVFFINTAAIFTKTLQKIPYHAKLLEHADQQPRVEYIAFFEMGGAFITFIGFMILACLPIVLSLETVLLSAIIIGSFSGLMANLIRK